MADQSERLELRGEVGALIGSRDWSKTPLGPRETWPSSLKTMIGVMLGSRFPMMLGWGPDLLEFYNDAYVPVLGVKHPASLGAPVRSSGRRSGMWSAPDAQRLVGWPGFMARARAALHQQPRLRAGDVPHLLAEPRARRRRQGRRRSPHGPGDDRAGQGERQLETLRALADRTGVARTAAEACVIAASVLEGADADVPFSLVYLLGDDGVPTLAAASPASLAGRIDLRAPGGGWPFHEALRSGASLPVDGLARRFGSLPGGRYGVTPERAVVVPLLRDERERYGFVVFGLGVWRAPSEGYLGFLALVASQLASAIARARASEEERQRTQAMAELDRAKTLVLQQHQPRVPHTADADARADDGRAPHARADARRPRPRDRPPQRASPAKARRKSARLRAHRGGTRARVCERHPPRRLTKELARHSTRSMREAGLAYEVSCERLPHPILIDPDMWEKILLNLISNRAEIHVSRGRCAGRWPPRGGEVELEVADTGIRIPARELPHIFDRFHRVPGHGRARRKGPASGLRWCTSSRHLLGGDVTGRSVVGAARR
jgi:hypothetical protein